MTRLTEEGQRIIADVASRHGISVDAACQMLDAVAAGHGSQAQFNIAELGGMGQWSQGGMTMVGDMFNHGLAARVNALCAELSDIVQSQPVFTRPAASQSQSQSPGGGVSLFVPSGSDWPAELGTPASVGAQNDMRYAYFPDRQRLAVDVGGRITVYDTGDHRISGFGQAQSGGQSLSFNSQYGLIDLSQLHRVDDGAAAVAQAPVPETMPEQAEAKQAPNDEPVTAQPEAQPKGGAMSDDQIFDRIERLAGLLEKGIITQSEFDAKKTELLARL
ncbi:hypothetical protein ATO6_07345 [Oceanicola sp. 22II-s10i]|uniref:SHOCT domain-containing protein n=1 Tax=Oceanicola sp. 22II-s10i TaxID=1317116 RepID=UPI000B522D01|nr:SHOCT domain-containing protein [Oceanicola sp. 22II-s10i]OWU86590.1 hypothetical protein ATO6_07345 [Oceanicola sp. 22II-s10i]